MTPRGLAGVLLLVGQALLIVLIVGAFLVVVPMAQELCPDLDVAACAAAVTAP